MVELFDLISTLLVKRLLKYINERIKLGDEECTNMLDEVTEIRRMDRE